MSKKALKTYENTLLYSKKPVTLSRDRGLHTSDNKKNRSEPYLDDRIDEFKGTINQKRVYRIPLRYSIDIGLVNFPESFSRRFIFTTEDNHSKLFESNAKIIAITRQKTEIYFHGMLYIFYSQIQLDENFEVCFNSSLRSKKLLRNEIQIMPYQQSTLITTRTQSVNVIFIGSKWQFLFLKISLVHDKSNQHQFIFNSYNVETATKVQSIKVDNASNSYSLTSKIEYDIDNEDGKYWLYTQFAAFNCRGCTITPLIDYAIMKFFKN